jgi:excisionase family DNA binding protein
MTPTATNLPTLLTTAQAAERLQLKEGTLREYQRRRLIPHIQLGRQIRYDAADLAAWLETIKRPAVARP